MSVRLKIISIIVIGVVACAAIALLDSIASQKIAQADLVREGINQGVLSAMEARIAEKEFMRNADGADCDKAIAKAGEAKNYFIAAGEMSAQIKQKTDVVIAILDDYLAKLSELRGLVLGSRVLLKDLSEQSHTLVQQLREHLTMPLQQEVTQAGFTGQTISGARTGVLDNAKNLIGMMSLKSINIQELILFQDIDRYDTNKIQIDKETKTFAKSLGQAIKLSRDKQFKKFLGVVKKSLAGLTAGEGEMVRLFTQQQSIEVVFQAQGQQLMGQGQGLLSSIKEKSAIDARGMKRTGWLLVGLVAVVQLGLGLLIGYSITSPLKRIGAFAKQVAGGDIQARPKGIFRAEMAQLNDDIALMVENLKHKMDEAAEKSRQAEEEAERARIATEEAEEARIQAERAKSQGMNTAAGQISGIVERVTSAAGELSGKVEQSSHGAELQRERAGETATAMEQMNATVLEVAKNASSAAESANNAKEQAQEGAEVVKQVVEAIRKVEQQAMVLKDNMTELGTQAEGIGQIMNVISDIADQTNLLALNAAIEAARAGDAGRGFAVVADEVRKLAEKTMTATREVGASIQAIQEGTRKNVAETDKAVEVVGESTGLAGKAGEMLHEILTISEINADQVRSIATGAEQQSAASEEINRGTEEINRISSETLEAMNQSAKAVSELSELAQEMQRLIEEMRQA